MSMTANTLSVLEIPYWIKKPNPENIFLHQPKLNAKLCVFLSEPITSEPAQKILTGMLTVLNLRADELFLSWHKNTKNELKVNLSFLEKLQPQNVLILNLNKDETNVLISEQMHIFVTYHPNELLEMPKLKREAYEVLLSLKNQIESGSYIK